MFPALSPITKEYYGRLFVFDGVDGAGKTTMIEMLATMVARGNSPEPWLEKILPSIRQPHASFLMDVDVETSITRIKQRKSFEDSYVEREHLEKSLASYRKVAECYDMHVISSADLGIEDAFSKIASIVDQLKGD